MAHLEVAPKGSYAGKGLLSALYFLNLRGEALIHRSYRDDLGYGQINPTGWSRAGPWAVFWRLHCSSTPSRTAAGATSCSSRRLR
jgi:hypothetical protein